MSRRGIILAGGAGTRLHPLYGADPDTGPLPAVWIKAPI